jgi:hypothetical protein
MSASEVTCIAAFFPAVVLVLAQVFAQEAAYPIGGHRRTKMSLPGMAHDSVVEKQRRAVARQTPFLGVGLDIEAAKSRLGSESQARPNCGLAARYGILAHHEVCKPDPFK